MKVGMFGSMTTLHDPTGAQFSLWQGEQHVGWQVNDDFGATTWYEMYSTDAKRARDFYSEAQTPPNPQQTMGEANLLPQGWHA